MKMKAINIVRVLTIVTCLIVFPVILESCCLAPGSCGCGSGDPPRDISVNKMEMQIYNGGTGTTSGQASRYNFRVVSTGELAMINYTLPTMAAFACSPAEPEAVQKIVSITAISNKEFTTDKSSYPPGSSLGEIFRANLGPSQHLFTEIKSSNPQTFGTSIIFYINATINQSQTHNLRFTIILDDGQVFNLDSGEIELTP